MKAGLHIAIVGSGNVGHHLQKALKGIATVHSVGRDLTVPEACEIVMVCVPDDSVARVCEQLPENKLVVHTAGAVPMQDNNRSGVFYPLYSFSKEADVNWSKIPILIEANSAEDLGGKKEKTIISKTKNEKKKATGNKKRVYIRRRDHQKEKKEKKRK
jgi:hypothetical protein